MDLFLPSEVARLVLGLLVFICHFVHLSFANDAYDMTAGNDRMLRERQEFIKSGSRRLD